MTDHDERSPFVFGAEYVLRRLGFEGPLPSRGHFEDTFAAGVEAASAALVRRHQGAASRVLAERDAIREALLPDPRPRPGHRFDARPHEYTLVLAGELRTIRIVD